MKRSVSAILLLSWIVFIIAAYYVVQKPELINVFDGFTDTLWTLIVAAILIFNSYGIGRRIIQWVGWDSTDSPMHLILGLGIGLGGLGVLGLGLTIAQVSNSSTLILIQCLLALVFLFTKDYIKLQEEIRDLARNLELHTSQFGALAKFILLLQFTLTFLLTLTPPFEAFDALLYHLTQPARVLQDGGLSLINVPHFWFPNITEHVYLWALAFHGERAAQILHFTWGGLSILLLVFWAVRTWSAETGRKTLLVLATMPSLPLLASWAYADMALSFYTIAALFLLTRYKTDRHDHQLRVLGIVCGLAMGVKYTSFVLPVSCGLLLLFDIRLTRAVRAAAQFSLTAILVALPWYARNAIFMGNPFYPFVFGGRYWDTFLANWYSGTGTGIGWDVLKIMRLPLDATLGYRDANYFDGRIGPVFLFLAPVTLWIFFTHPRRNPTQNWTLLAIGFFTALSLAVWTLGVINSSHLWQTRLVFPTLLPFAIPAAVGWHALTQFDTSKFRISFLVNFLIVSVACLTVFDNGVFVLQRNPLAIALGVQSRERYIERVNPAYASLIRLVDNLPEDARLYNLFEPRSYALNRTTQPDFINANFSHDLYLFNTPIGILRQWKSQGYTHILINNLGADLKSNDAENQFTPSARDALREVLAMLDPVSQTPDRVYSIYKIP